VPGEEDSQSPSSRSEDAGMTQGPSENSDAVSLEEKCVCTGPGLCHRHQVVKSRHWFDLCRQRADYFDLWEQGRGPGQHTVDTVAREATLREPGIGRKVINLSRAAINHIADQLHCVGNELFELRLGICRTCEYCDTSTLRCRHFHCGCKLMRKARWRSSECPLGKWEPVDAQGTSKSS
jgi:hypothetical protein